MSGCDLTSTYLLLSVSPPAILAYAVEGLFGPIVWVLWTRNPETHRRRIWGLIQTLKAYT